MRIAIIGYGVVGQNLHKEFPEAEIIDPPKSLYGRGIYDISFISVPTEMNEDGSCNTSIVEKAIMENESDVFCIKSTIPPGTTERIIKETGKKCIFSPEYFGGTVHANDPNYQFVTLGGERSACNKVAEIYKKKRPGKFKIAYTDAKTAELVKYMENTFLACKVVFSNEFFRIAEKIGIDYDELRELFLLDPRVNPSHTVVHRDEPFYNSHCLNKDVPAIADFAKSIGYDPIFINAIIQTNNLFKSQK